MKDRSSWTDEQINEAIAKAKGYVWAEWAWVEPISRNVAGPTDYTHDWQLAGELLEDMQLYQSVWKTQKGWICAKFGEITGRASTPQRAICEAWLAWKEQG